MQLLRGSTLEALLDRADYESSPPSVAWATAITTQIAAVLADMHRVDIVHRDVKPSNVMIVDGGLVKVLDFGDPARCGSAPPADPGRPDRRHTRIHVTGAGSRKGRNVRVRHLLAWLLAVRAADW
jgi:serine/threonine protein kinase